MLAPFLSRPFSICASTLIFSTLPKSRNMSNGTFKIPRVINEPNVHYAPKSPERIALQAALVELEQAAPFKVEAYVNGAYVCCADAFHMFTYLTRD